MALSKKLQVPLLPTWTESTGIASSDIILRTALVMALADIRANDWLLDFCFANLPRDKYSATEYGEKELQQAKSWFLNQNVEVIMSVRPPDNDPPANCITIALLSSGEGENTLGDVHYEPREQMESNWKPLTPQFTPISYDAITGIVTMPDNVANGITISKYMCIVDKVGTPYPIQESLTYNTFTIGKGTVADFTSCFIKPGIPTFVTSLESASFREQYYIGVHTAAEPKNLTYLHSVVVFALLRYRQPLLEARGLERSSISSSDFKAENIFGPEGYFSRYISLTGYVRHVWPTLVSERVLSVGSNIKVDAGPTVIDWDADTLSFNK